MATLVARVAFINGLRHVKTAPVQLSQLSAAPLIFRPFSSSAHQVNTARSKLLSLGGPRHNQLVGLQYVRYLSANKPKTEQSTQNANDADTNSSVTLDEQAEVKPTLFQRFKQMYRDYWYVLVPVHLITSAGWFGGFYYMAKSGIDVVAIMESYNISSKLTSPLKDSSLGYVAIAYAMYKIATPIRYTVTLGGTTVSITYLRKFGYIKPVPTREQLKEMYNSKRDIMLDTVKDKREELRIKKELLKDRTDNLIDDMERKIVTKINDTKKKTTNTIEKP